MKIILLILILLINYESYSQAEPFWDSVATPDVGQVSDIEIDNLDNIYITSANGLWISTNQGENWRKILDGYFGYILYKRLAVSSSDEIAVYLFNEEIRKYQILYSSDFGSTWLNWNFSMNLDYGDVLLIEWDNNNTLYVLEKRSDNIFIHYSKNLDTNWSHMEASFKTYSVPDMSVLNDSCIAFVCRISGSDVRSCFTSDKGKTWKEIYFSNTWVNCINYFSRDEIFLGTKRGLQVLKNEKELELISPDTINVMSMYIPNRKEIYLGATNNYVYFSLDSGKTWHNSKNGMEHLGNPRYDITTSIFNIRRDSYGNLYAQTYEWGIYRSTDEGASWHPSNNGFFSSRIHGIAFDKDKNVYLATNGLFKSSDNGKSWQSVVGLNGNSFTCVFVNSKNYIYASGYQYDALFRSKDEGKTWEKITKGLVTVGGNIATLYNMVENEQGYLFVTHEGGSVLRSFDDGDSWDWSRPYHVGGHGSGEDIALNSEGHIFTTGDAANLYRSTNNGDDWELLFQDTHPSSDVGYQPILFYPNSQIGYVYLYTFEPRGTVLNTTDNGRTWINVEDNGLAHLFGYKPRVIDSLYNSYWSIFCYSPYWRDHFIIRTNPEGEIIDTVISGLKHTYREFNIMAVSPDGYVWGAANFGGIYRSRERYVSVEASPQQTKTTLNQNIPNPFENHTKIPYTLDRADFVKLSIHNIFGNKIAVLANQYQQAGSHTAIFYTDNYPAGVYFYKLEVGGEVITKKMQIIR